MIPAAEPSEPERRWDLAAVLLLFGAAVVVVAAFRDYGVTWDEPYQQHYGELVLRYFASGFADTRVLAYRDLYLYGGGFDLLVALAQRLSPLGPYETRHLVTASVGLLGLVGAWRLARETAGPRAAFVATLLLVLTPRFWGHMFNNPKDLPFAVGYVWSLYLLVRMLPDLPRVPWRRAVGLGVAIGLTLAVRAGGMLLFGYVGLVLLVWAAVRMRRNREGLRGDLLAATGRLAAVVAVAWVLMLASWPWTQTAPFTRPFEGLAALTHFHYQGRVLFGGVSTPAPDLPLTYLPTWLAITLPAGWLLLLALGLGLAIHRAATYRGALATPRAQTLGLLAFAVLFPLAYAMARRSVVYDGMRHFLFVLPVLAVLAAAALERLLVLGARRSRTLVVSGLAAAGLYLASHVATVVELHPYETVYFNELVGGLPGAAGRYETDYWGNSYHEAVRSLAALRAPDAPVGGYGVAACTEAAVIAPDLPAGFHLAKKASTADFFVSTTRWSCHERFPGKVSSVVERFGVPLAVVVDRRSRLAHNPSAWETSAR